MVDLGAKAINRREADPAERWVEPVMLIYPLKKRGEGEAVKSKKRKIESSSQIGTDNQQPPVLGGPFVILTDEIQQIRQLVVGLPQGPGRHRRSEI
ncbi:hypothetical protein HAX54_049360 [Datura stramonium]|uniref:Uncharacterized protein n=1 Tax=Datura stramonium TaxID=4076 RepID=A0ABS8SVB9_DATST|nr:hypothetical protein [Datura stramonium]